MERVRIAWAGGFLALTCALVTLLPGQDARAGNDAEQLQLRPAPPVIGAVEHLVDVLGETRKYVLHIPASGVGKALPAVVVLHGHGGTPFQISQYFPFDAIAEREGFVVVYPEGQGRYWKDVRFKNQLQSDTVRAAADVAFLNVLAADLAAKGIADAKRIYLTGISNGGFMVTTMACLSPRRFAAFAPVIATAPVIARELCKGERPLPLLVMNGTSDPMTVWDAERAEKIGYLGGENFFTFWSRLNGCRGREELVLEDVDDADGSRVSHISATGCRAGGDTELYRVNGGGHHPPTLEHRPAGSFRGARNHDIEAPEVIWAFFKRFSN